MILKKNRIVLLGLIILIATEFYSDAIAQINFYNHSIVDSPYQYIYAADIDGDTDIDIITAGYRAFNWWENTDGYGDFKQDTVYSEYLSFITSIITADIDGDGDQDVLTSSKDDDQITWFENTNGLGSFGSERIIALYADGASCVFAADIDGDSDMDVLSASANDNKIAWYKNTDGLGEFSTEIVISTNAKGAKSIYVIDIDGDGDLDVLSASANDNKIAWYKNIDGQGSFSAEIVVTTNANFAISVYAADLDGDGDVDVISGSEYDSKIAWYRNTDGQGTFGSQQIITANASWPIIAYAADIDGDGDLDVFNRNWYENTDGLGNFSSAPQIFMSLDKVYPADIDADGDIDIVSVDGTQFGGLSWSENIGDNDACNTALDASYRISAESQYIGWQNANAATNNNGFQKTCGTNSSGENGSMNDGVWYTLNAMYDGDISVYVRPDSSWDPEIGVYSGSCSSLTCVNSVDNGGKGEIDSISFPVLIGKDYFINIGHWSPSSDEKEGFFSIQIGQSCGGACPANDYIANAIQVLTDNYTDTAVKIPCAFPSYSHFNNCEFKAYMRTVYYKFKANSRSEVIATISNPIGKSRVVFYEAPDLNSYPQDLNYVNQLNNFCNISATSSINTEPGHYYYLVVSNGSITDVTITGVSYSGVKDISIANFTMYPNPAENILFLKAEVNIHSISIYNILGQKIIHSKPNSTKTQLDISSLSAGIYIVELMSDQQSASYTLIINK